MRGRCRREIATQSGNPLDARVDVVCCGVERGEVEWGGEVEGSAERNIHSRQERVIVSRDDAAHHSTSGSAHGK